MDEQVRIIVSGVDDVNALNTALGQTISLLKTLNSQGFNLNRSGLNQINSAISMARQGVESIAGVFSGTGKFFGMTGRFAQTLGNSFTQMSSLFQTNFIDTVEKSLTFMMTRFVTKNLSNIFTRADILNTFSSYMELMDVSSFASSKALERVDKSIRGLPIGLDEAAQRLRRYTMLSNDIDRATDITIGIQKAITAGGASAQMKNTAYLQMDRLMAVGKLTTSRQWMALINGLGTSARFVAEAMGLEGFTGKDLVAGLISHDISTESFLDAIAALGEGTIAAAKELDEALSIYKSTYESWWSNIQFAFIRGGANVVNAISDSLESGTGVSIIGYMERFRNGVNDLFSGIRTWVGDNSSGFARIIDSIRNFFGVFREIGMDEMASKVLENVAKAIDLIAFAISKLASSQIGEFLAFAMTLAGPLGKLFNLLGGALPVLLGVFQRFKEFDFSKVIDALVKSMEAFAKVIETMLRILPDSVLTWIMSFALVWGKPLSKVLQGVAGAIRLIGSIGLSQLGTGVDALSMGLMNLGGGFAALKAGLSVVGPVLPVLASATALILATAHAFEYYRKQREAMQERADEITGLTSAKEIVKRSQEARETARSTIEDSEQAIKTQVQNEKAANELIKEILEINDGEHLGALTTAVAQLNALYPDWGIQIDAVTKKLDDNSEAILRNASSYEVASRAEARTNLLETYTNQLTTEKLNREDIESFRNYYGNQWHQYQTKYNKLYSRYEEYLERNKGRVRTRSFEDYLNTVFDNNGILRSGDSSIWNNPDNAFASTFGTQFLMEYESAKATYDLYNGEYMASTNAIDLYRRRIKILRDDIQRDLNTQELWESVTGTTLGATKAMKEALGSLTEEYGSLGEAAVKSIESQIAGFGELDKIEEYTLEDLRKNLQARLDLLTNYNKGVELLMTIGDMAPEERGALPEGLNEYGVQQALDYILNQDFNESAPTVKTLMDAWNAGDKLGFYTTLAQIWQIIQETHKAGTLTDQARTAFSETMDELIEQYSVLSPEEKEELRQKMLDAMREALAGGEVDHAEAINALVQGVLGGPLRPEDVVNLATEYFSSKEVEELVKTLAEQFKTFGVGAEDAGQWLLYYVKEGLITAGDALDIYVKQYGEEKARLYTELLTMTLHPTVTITPDVRLTDSGNFLPVSPADLPFNRSQNGGLVNYLAKGGWPTSGSDIVPAMLTPGEFVQKKAAVETFGKEFMERVNALDIRGSIDSMSRRFGLPFMGGPFVSMNHIRDNHATVNQTNITNNQNFTYKKAFRFASGLA